MENCTEGSGECIILQGGEIGRLYHAAINTKQATREKRKYVLRLARKTSLRGQLLPHQLDGVMWMLEREAFAWDKCCASAFSQQHHEALEAVSDSVLMDGSSTRQVAQRDEMPFAPSAEDVSRHMYTSGTCDGGVLGDDMGMGKTLQALALIAIDSLAYNLTDTVFPNATVTDGERNGHNTPWQTVVVCPSSVTRSWVGQAAEWFEWRLTSDEDAKTELRPLVSVLENSAHVHQESDGSPTWSRSLVVIASYEIVFRDSIGRRLLSNHAWRRVVLDEAHRMRNDPATCVCLRHLRAARRWALTGTLYHNGVQDIAQVARFVAKAPYCTKSWWTRHGRNETKVREWKRQHLRMRNKDLLCLPPLQCIDVPVALTDLERREYDLAVVEALSTYKKASQQRSSGNVAEDASRKATAYVLQTLRRLRQFCNHPVMGVSKEVFDDEMTRWERHAQRRHTGRPRRQTETKRKTTSISSAVPQRWVDQFGFESRPGKDQMLSSKLGAVVETAEQIVKEKDSTKIVMFSQWTGTIRMVRLGLGGRVACAEYLGSMTQKQRGEILDTFRNGEARVLLVSLRAGGVGINLSCASHVFMIDGWYNPFLEKQAIDRVNRLGQSNSVVTCLRFFVPNTVEEDVRAIQSGKRQGAESFYKGPDDKAKSAELSPTQLDRPRGSTHVNMHREFGKIAQEIESKNTRRRYGNSTTPDKTHRYSGAAQYASEPRMAPVECVEVSVQSLKPSRRRSRRKRTSRPVSTLDDCMAWSGAESGMSAQATTQRVVRALAKAPTGVTSLDNFGNLCCLENSPSLETMPMPTEGDPKKSPGWCLSDAELRPTRKRARSNRKR